MNYLCKILILAIVMASIGADAYCEVITKSGTFNGTLVNYIIVLPQNFSPARTYPAVLAFAGGGQDMPTMRDTLNRNWIGQSQKRNYLVFMPEAPNGDLFYANGDRIFPAFLDQLLKDYKIEARKFHVAGRSNGGLSAFHIAALFPKYFLSVTGFPGFLLNATDADFEALKFLPIFMFAGGNDLTWLSMEKQQYDQMKAKGLRVSLEIEEGQNHAIETLMDDGSKRLFDHFDEASRLFK